MKVFQALGLPVDALPGVAERAAGPFCLSSPVTVTGAAGPLLDLSSKVQGHWAQSDHILFLHQNLYIQIYVEYIALYNS